MKFTTVARTISATVSATVIVGVIVGCGSDDNTGGADGRADSPLCVGAGSLTAEGSTSQKNAIDLFAQAWGRLCPGKTLSYHQSGSAAGREQFIAGRVDFAGSDSALAGGQVEAAAKRCHGHPAWHLPLVFGPIALAYHLDGVDNLVVNADVLAEIFSGGIRTWNDPAIAALNPDAALPATRITPIFREDSSGTTDNFQKYLTVAAPRTWTKGAGSEFQGGVGEGAQKSAGIVQAVQSTPGAIGYVEQGFVAHGMRFAQIDTGSGPTPLTEGAVSTAIQAARFESEGDNDLRLDLNSLYSTKVVGAYPLVLVTYEIVCSQGYAPGTAAAVRSFLTVAADSGQDGLLAAGYVPLPARLKERLTRAIEAIG